MYNLSEPRVAVAQLDHSTFEERDLELGQGNTFGEAMFFLSIGYRVSVSRWDGKMFSNEANYYPDDLV